MSIEPGQRDRVMALIRNQGSIVDNYQLRVEGMPDDWWSIYPDTVYLVPFGTGGTYEQEVEVHIHPPRSPEAKAKLWELEVVAHSKAQSRTAASAPMGLVIQPYTETATVIRPQRAKGRRKAHYDVAVENKANAPVLIALEGEDPDDELDFGFNRPPHEVPPGKTIESGMQVRPPKQIWIGRATEKRFTVNTLTGEKAEERLAAEPTSAAELENAPAAAPKKKGLFGRRPSADGVPGVYGPRVYKPQVYKPGMQIGPSGISFQKPQFTRPADAGPADEGHEPRREQAQDARQGRGVVRAERPAAALAGRLPPEGVAAVVADPGRDRARRARGAALHAAAQERRRARRRRLQVDVRRREEADRRRPQARRLAEGEGRPQGPGRQRHRPDPRGRREGREGRSGDRADRGRRRQDHRPEGRRHEPRRRRGRAARQEAHGRQDGADAARSRGHDREPDPGRERDRQGRRADRHLLRRPQRQGQGQGPEGQGRRPPAQPAAAVAVAVAAAAARRTSSSRRSPAPRSTTSPRSWPTTSSSRRPSGSSTPRPPARCSRPSRPAAPRPRPATR